MTFTPGGTLKTMTFTVAAADIDCHAETENLALHLSSASRSNNEANPGIWTYGTGEDQIAATFTNFNWKSDGWQMDADGLIALRVSGDARLTIPYKPFAQDFRATGKTIEIQTDPFVVVGVAEKRAQTKLKINSVEDYWTYADTSAGTIFIPIDTWPIVYRYDEPQSVAVQALSTDDMTKAGSNVAKALTSKQIQDVGNQSSKFTYTADDLLKEASRMQQLANATNNQLIWIAAISLLVGGIGVMNIMLVSVTERTREIGLKKAIGAKRKKIAAQFLTEAAVLTSLGGLIGVVSGIVLSRVVSNIMGTPSAISIPACIVAVGFSMGIGIIFGLLPALKASKLNPIDALRSE